jgi:hypothetical protein
MEGNRKNLGTPGSPGPVAAPSSTPIADDLDEDDAEEHTNPGIDPELISAFASLRRVQGTTRRRASDIEALLVRRKTPFPR